MSLRLGVNKLNVRLQDEPKLLYGHIKKNMQAYISVSLLQEQILKWDRNKGLG